jgi:hypothetical protein
MITGDGITVFLLENTLWRQCNGKMKPNWNMCVLILKILLKDLVLHEATLNCSLSIF